MLIACMDSSQTQKALDSSNEVTITVTGRKTGSQYSTPVWFVRDGKTVFPPTRRRFAQPMVQECPQVKADRDLFWESLA
jgi:hypothetical protein